MAEQRRLLTHLGSTLGAFASASLPLCLTSSSSLSLGAQMDGSAHFPEIWEAESCHLPICLEWGGQRIECRFPTRLHHPDQQGRGGRTQQRGCNIRVKLELWWQLIVRDGPLWRGFPVRTPQVGPLSTLSPRWRTYEVILASPEVSELQFLSDQCNYTHLLTLRTLMSEVQSCVHSRTHTHTIFCHLSVL